jgi:hypothetical protein
MSLGAGREGGASGSGAAPPRRPRITRVAMVVDHRDRDRMPGACVDVARRIVPGWGGDTDGMPDLLATPITGGLTNLLWKVERKDATGAAGTAPAVLVRVFGENTEVMIDRDVETGAR